VTGLGVCADKRNVAAIALLGRLQDPADVGLFPVDDELTVPLDAVWILAISEPPAGSVVAMPVKYSPAATLGSTSSFNCLVPYLEMRKPQPRHSSV
jgi:hypothetical protein